MIKIFTALLTTVSIKRFYIFLGVSLVVAGITLWFAFELAPWLYAMNARIELHLQAPADTKINICWDKTQIECLPLVPYLSAEQRIADTNEVADVWLSELPTRPEYTLSLLFKSKSKITKGIFQDLEVNSQRILVWGYIPNIGVQDIKLRPDEFSATGVTYTIRDGLYYFEGGQGSHLTATREIKPGPPGLNHATTTLPIWGILFSAYLLLALPLYFLPFAVQNRQDATRNLSLRDYPRWLYILCGAAIISFLLLVIYSPAMFNMSDQIVYLNIALRQAWLLYPARPPGYYMFVAFLFWLSDNQLEAVLVAQAIILASSAVLCIWALRRWLHPLVVIPLICGILFSPSQMSWVRAILRESIFASLILLGVTAVIAHFTTPSKLEARIWLVVFAVVCALALFVRENGIILPGILLPALLPDALKRLNSSDLIWKRLQSIFLLFIRYSVPVACTGIVYLGMSCYNYLNYGYFQFTLHVTSHHFLWQEISPANFDARGLLEADDSMTEEAKTYLGQRLYRSFVIANTSPGLDRIYTSLLPIVNQITVQKGQPVNFFHAASILDQIGKNVYKWVPLKADLIGMIRQYGDVLVSNPGNGRYALVSDDPAGFATKRELLDSVVKMINYKGTPIKYQGKPLEPNSIISQYYRITDAYGWYRALFVLALLFSVYLLRYHDPVLLVPITFFIANALLMVMLRGVLPRFIEDLDVLLVLQVGLGLSCWIYRHFSVVSEKSNLSS
jgi:hypothetical protein